MKYFALILGFLALVLAGCTTSSVEEQCVSEGEVVCGVDEVTYLDACAAEKAGVEIAHVGQCIVAPEPSVPETTPEEPPEPEVEIPEIEAKNIPQTMPDIRAAKARSRPSAQPEYGGLLLPTD